jgi:hypothetical protein
MNKRSGNLAHTLTAQQEIGASGEIRYASAEAVEPMPFSGVSFACVVWLGQSFLARRR